MTNTFPEHYQVGQLYQFERPQPGARIPAGVVASRIHGENWYYKMHDSTFNTWVEVNGNRPCLYIKRSQVRKDSNLFYDVFLGTDKDDNAVEFVVWCSEVPFLFPC